tara:strand:+ start:4141 stop:4992 length:852 start_codon:yes stop_codon:yes gene_type:complete
MDSDFETINIYEVLNEYTNKINPVIYILTPCFGSVCFVNYIECLMKTKELCRELGIRLEVLFCKSDSLVTRARNNLIAKAMSDPDMTHMFFIDNDITWVPTDILKLLIADKPIIGGIYPYKKYNFDKLLPTEKQPNQVQDMIDVKNNSHLHEINDKDTIEMNILTYNVNYNSKEVKIKNNLTQVKHVATGFMMIQRNVIEKMTTSYHSTKYTDDINFLTTDENKYAYALFDCGVLDDHYLSEDWMFCNRWTLINGEIWIDISINLTHTGIHDFKGCYMSSLLR